MIRDGKFIQEPRLSGLDEIYARRALLAQRISEMDIIPLNEIGEIIPGHPDIKGLDNEL